MNIRERETKTEIHNKQTQEREREKLHDKNRARETASSMINMRESETKQQPNLSGRKRQLCKNDVNNSFTKVMCARLG